MWTTIIVKCMTMSGQLLINGKCKICSGQAIVSCMLVCQCLSWGVAEEDCHCISTLNLSLIFPILKRLVGLYIHQF